MATKKKSSVKDTRTQKITFGTKKTRKGVHAKSKNSKLKQSKTYRKKYRGQGK
jgi:hypothetical protein